jgi:hypothetical protein
MTKAPMLMPLGKFKGRPVADMEPAYLMWLVTNDDIRYRRWPLVKEAMRVLRDQLGNDFGGVLARLEVKEPPPKRWQTPERDAAKALEKAAKLQAVEQARAAKKAANRAAFLATRPQTMAAQADALRKVLGKPAPPAQPEAHAGPSGVHLDAAQFVRQARQQRAADPNDVTDLL